MTKKHQVLCALNLILVLLSPSHIHAKTTAEYDSALLRVKISAARPQGISAFYEARGFHKEMINILKQQCFITVYIKNKSNDFIWLDLSKWKFTHNDGEVTRLDRNYWKNKWQLMNIPLAHQSTFRWTLIPEQLDFHPGEREGGNIILPRTGKSFNITASFPTRADKQGKPVSINFNNLECAPDQ